MQRKIGDLVFRNPVIAASGTFGMGELYSEFLDYSKIGGITLKTITKNPRKGNPPPRILEVPGGLLNSIGLENAGFDKFYNDLKNEDIFAGYQANIILSIAGDDNNDFIEMTEAFSEIKSIDMLELNLSCPNVYEGGKTFDSCTENVQDIVYGVSKVSKKPFSTKLSPNYDVVANAIIAEKYGSNAVTISNTFLGLAIDIKTKGFYFRNKTAGYSGPGVKPIALHNVYKTAGALSIPIIASGGISSTEDAIEFLLAGASLVSIGTMNFIEPDIAGKIASGIDEYFK